MRKTRANRPDGQLSPARGKRNTAASDFAAAITRAEFGRFYVDADRLREATKSVAEAIVRRKPTPEAKPDKQPEAADESAEPAPGKPAGKRQHVSWRPLVRERRTEIATGLSRIRRESKQRG